VTSSLAGGDFGKGAVTGALAGAVTMGVTSAIGSVSNAGAGAGAGGSSAASTAAPLGEGLGVTTLGKNAVVGISKDVAANAPQTFSNMKGAGLLSKAGSSAVDGVSGAAGSASNFNMVQSAYEEGFKPSQNVADKVAGGEPNIIDKAKDWWGGMDAAKQGNWMELAGDTVGGIGKGLLSGMQAEDERSWREKMYERMQRDNTIDFNRNDTPSTQGYRVADNYQAIPQWLKDRIGRR
jgi:hypothetical protein